MVGGRCVDGERCECPPLTTQCGGPGGPCALLSQSPEHCGSCGNACPAGSACLEGECLACPDGEEVCETPDGTACVDLANSVAHCGACENPCPAGVPCLDGVCTLDCDPGLDFCLGTTTCVDLDTNAAHCGTCDAACPEASACADGRCACDDEGLEVCGAECVNTSSSTRHCGDCEAPCGVNERCEDRACVCPTELTECGGDCTDLGTDPAHCGDCSVACDAGYACADGACLCQAPRSVCDAFCVAVGQTTAHCAECGDACESGACVDAGCRGARALALGDALSCAALAGGSVTCWGRSVDGGDASGPEGRAAPTATVALELSVTALASGGAHSCALLEDETVWCWGANSSGQLGRSALSDFEPPGPVPVSGTVVEIGAGVAHSCARTVEGELWCWGRAEGVSEPPGEPIPTPRQLELPLPALSMVVGGATTCVSHDDGRKTCHGALDLFFVDASEFPSVVLGRGHGCLVVSGVVSCFGANGAGQCGTDPRRDEIRRPVEVEAVADAVAVAVGDTHSCAVDGEGAVWCWGDNAQGQLGRGTEGAPSAEPIAVPLPEAVVRIAAGARHTCAASDTRVWCWGAGEGGQLGDGEGANTPRPVEVRWW